MAKRIVWTEQAKADVRGIEQSIALQILKTLARYVQIGEGNGSQGGLPLTNYGLPRSVTRRLSYSLLSSQDQIDFLLGLNI